MYMCKEWKSGSIVQSEGDQMVFFCSCDFWWKTNEMTSSRQICFNSWSTKFRLSQQWCHCDRSHPQSASSGGGLTWIWFIHRLHLNLNDWDDVRKRTRVERSIYLSWVSLRVVSFKRNRSRNSSAVKCRSTSSSWSTTQLLSAFLWAWRWKIFSSKVPVWKHKIDSILRPSGWTYRNQTIDVTLFLLSISPYTSHGLIIIYAQTVGRSHPCNVNARGVLAGFQSGSNMTKRLAPIKLRPQPPALLLSMKIKSEL